LHGENLKDLTRIVAIKDINVKALREVVEFCKGGSQMQKSKLKCKRLKHDGVHVMHDYIKNNL
jgi:hypothetical protein